MSTHYLNEFLIKMVYLLRINQTIICLQNLFEQIWAANDYEMFKRMMTQRNVELQLQALELIERRYGITPQSFIPKTKEDNIREIPVTVEKSSDFENEVMDEVKKYVEKNLFNIQPS